MTSQQQHTYDGHPSDIYRTESAARMRPLWDFHAGRKAPQQAPLILKSTDINFKIYFFHIPFELESMIITKKRKIKR